MMAESHSPSRGRRRYWTVLLVFLLSAGVRSLFLLEVREDPTYRHLVHDEAVNDRVACAILDGTLPSDAYYKAPLYMYALAGVYRVLGSEPMRARWVGVFVDSLSPVLILLIAGHLFGRTTGIIAGVVAAVFWSFVFYSAELVDTSLACVLYLLLAWLLLALPDGRAGKWALCGAVLGLGAITRPNVLAFAPVLAATIVVTGWLRARRELRSTSEAGMTPSRQRAYGRPVWHVVALTIGCCLTILPVTIRNRVTSGEWVLIGTYGGLNFYVANSPWSDGKHGPLIVGQGIPDASAFDPNNLWSRLDLNYNVAKTHAQARVGRQLEMGQVDAFFHGLTRDYIRSHPRKFLVDCVKRFCWFFNRYEFPNVKRLGRLCGVSDLLGALSWFHFGILCPIAMVGLMLALVGRHRAEGWVAYLAMLAALFLPGLFFVMNSRYRLPTVYLLVPLAAYGAVRFVKLWQEPTGWSLRIVSCAVLAGMALLSNLDLFGYAADTHHTELRMTYAEACERTGRYDLLGEAAAAFETAYFDELDNRDGLPWASMLHHCGPRGRLFEFYDRLAETYGREEDTRKALHFGRQMIQRESFSPPIAMAYYRLLLAERERDMARTMLDVFETHLLALEPSIAIQCFMRYWDAFKDRSILRHTQELLVPLCRDNPGNHYLRFTSYSVDRLLKMTAPDSRPGRAPATTSRATSRPTPQEAPLR